MPKEDFRKKLNAVLKIFYDKNSTINIIEAIRELKVPLIELDHLDNIWTICNSLQQDKHIELISSPQEVPVGHITAPGRIFYEQGGYRDQRNHVDRTIDWFKNHKVFSILILAGIALSFLYGTVKIILDILSWFK